MEECAAQGTKAIECGINQETRPEKCCDGLICDALKFCSPIGEVPTASPTVFIPPTVACASVNERAQDCGAANTARPQSCCGDLVCVEGAGVICIDPNAEVTAPTAEETAPEPVEPTVTPTVMAVDPAESTVEPTPDLGLDEPTGVPATTEPTPADASGVAPVAAPTVAETVMTPEPTEMATEDPTMAPVDVMEPMEPTAEPTVDDSGLDFEPAPPTSSAGRMATALAVVAVAIAAPLFL